MGRLSTATSIELLEEVDFVVEAIVENVEAKRELFKRSTRLRSPHVILASNTSSISITTLGAATKRPDQRARHALHEPGPADDARRADSRAGDVATMSMQTASELCAALGKTPIEAADYPGFIANRILMPMINEAVFALMEGVGTADAIDAVMKLGMNHPMGPLTLADFIGLDVCLAILERAARRARRSEVPSLPATAPDGRRGPSRSQGRPRLLHVLTLSSAGSPARPDRRMIAISRAPSARQRSDPHERRARQCARASVGRKEPSPEMNQRWLNGHSISRPSGGCVSAPSQSSSRCDAVREPADGAPLFPACDLPCHRGGDNQGAARTAVVALCGAHGSARSRSASRQRGADRDRQAPRRDAPAQYRSDAARRRGTDGAQRYCDAREGVANRARHSQAYHRQILRTAGSMEAKVSGRVTT